MLPYSIDVVCLDQGGIVSGLSGFFSSRGIDIAEVSTRSYPAAHTGAPMFSVQMIVNVPSPHPCRAPTRRVHGVLRLSEPRRDSRAGEVLTNPIKTDAKVPDFTVAATAGLATDARSGA